MRVKPDRADLSGRPQDPQQLQGPRFQPPEQVPAAMSALSLVVLSLLTAMPPASCQRGWRGKRHWASQRNLQRQTQASGWDVFPTKSQCGSHRLPGLSVRLCRCVAVYLPSPKEMSKSLPFSETQFSHP
ncbi:PREDICTED: PDZK1-interacting protein 1 isoform X4 [Capra hircus]|uniref:PDZK1-interacting protein 1 isoform X4 n=1 Tax=Capra hircus TaxID=9925 RepID=UPI0006B12757|nr:PREDICTED: PDZK1-interacting protein 1 isoform X4 [Capra hircus]